MDKIIEKELENLNNSIEKIKEDKRYINIISKYLFDVGSNLTVNNIKRTCDFIKEVVVKMEDDLKK